MNAAIPALAMRELERPVIRRGALAIIEAPLEIWLNEVRIKLSPLETALMLLLMRRGWATWQAVDAILRDGASSATVRSVMIYRIRQKFIAAGGEDPIETVRGWGLKLRVPPDRRQSTSLGIGERRPAP